MPILPARFYQTKLFLTFLATIACFVLTFLYYGFYYVEYEGLWGGFFSGSLTEGMPFRSIYFLGNIGTSFLYSKLYEINSTIEWISWIHYGYLFVSSFIGLYIVIDLLPDSTSRSAKVSAQIIIYLLVFADHNIHFIYTRVSYMVAGVSLIALLYFFRQADSIKERPWLFIFLNFWFILGTLTRVESSAAVFLQIAIFGIFYLQHIKRLAQLFIFPFLLLFILSASIAYDLKTSTEYYKQVEPEIEAQFCERENITPLSEMKSERDSVMWKAAKTILWSDPKVMTAAYMRSLVRPEKFIYTDGYHWHRVYDDVLVIALRFWYLVVLCILLALALLIYGKFAKPSSYVLWLLFVLSFWFLTCLQTYTIKVNDRSFSPLISLFIFCHFLILLPYLNSGITRWKYPILAGFFVLFGFHLLQLKKESNQLGYDLGDYQKNLKIITEMATDKILAMNSTSCDYLFLSNKPFHPFNFSAFKKIYITDGFNIPFLPYYRRYLEKECRCNMYDFPVFWDYLRAKHEEVVIVSTTQRMNILTEYLKVIYKYDLPVTKNSNTHLLQLQKSDNRGTFVDLTVYDLGR
jgi:hypothetical protein